MVATPKTKTYFHDEMKKIIRSENLFKKFGMSPLANKTKNAFTEVRLPIDDKELTRAANLPLADAGGKVDDNILVFVEFDSGGQISHTLLKFLYYLENPHTKPKELYLFHIYGKEFTEEYDKDGYNYLFHKRLVTYLIDRIEERCGDTEFIYVSSRDERYGFAEATEAYKWLEGKFEEYFS